MSENLGFLDFLIQGIQPVESMHLPEYLEPSEIRNICALKHFVYSTCSPFSPHSNPK